MQRIVLIGHRGVGKTSLARRIAGYLQTSWSDLDQAVETQFDRAIADYFPKDEALFRQRETSTLKHLLENRTSVVAVGAGFQGWELLHDWKKKDPALRILWVRRPSDLTGRIFLDRPALSDASPLDEFHAFRKIRDPIFSQVCTEELWLSEGFDFPNNPERKALLLDASVHPGILTLFPKHLEKGFPRFERYELRTDLLSKDAIESFREKIPSHQILLSYRTTEWRHFPARQGEWVDWPYEWGQPTTSANNSHWILSSHDALIEPESPHLLKAAPWVSSWKELIEGHEWWMRDPRRRSFLPRSTDGRWTWYRLWMLHKQPMAFVRVDEGSCLDQPTLHQVHQMPGPFDHFGAVLGDPVSLSHSPALHFDFFRERGMPFFSISIVQGDWPLACQFLLSLGLRFAAVTTPLKQVVAPEEGSVNTLRWLSDEVSPTCANTDLDGLRDSVGMDSLGSTVLWGGGGTEAIVKAVLPDVHIYSARTGLLRSGASQDTHDPDTLIWAVPPARQEACKWPSPQWKPKLVIDLNYFEHSPARTYAKSVGALYRSGKKMLASQAEMQRKFWK